MLQQRQALTLALAIGTAFLSGCGEQSQAKAPAPAPVAPVLELAASDIAHVQQYSLQAGVAITGQLQAYNYTTVQSEVSANVAQVRVREGEAVHKGQVIVQLATQDLHERLKQTEATLASAKAEAILAAAVQERNEQLHKDHYISDIDYKRGVAEAKARAETVKAQEAMVVMARKALADAVITAPMSGIVAKRYVQAGQMVMANAQIADIVDLHELELVATVPAEHVAALTVGQNVTFSVQGFTGSFHGQVSRINPVADSSTRAVTFYARVINPAQQLKAGLFVQGRLQLGEAHTGLTLPSTAIRYDDNKQPYVWVLKQHKLVKQPVVLGVSDTVSAQTQISQGVAAGDTIVLAQLTEKAANITVKMAE